jgi:two-component system, response regulator PdtaR
MGRAIRILLVDDDILPAMLMQRQLGGMGFEITEIATTGEKAIRSARKDPPDIVLMDIQLAGLMDGIEAASAIVAESRIPVIFLTGYEDREKREKASPLAPLAYLIKPVNVKKLGSLIEGYFAGKRAT